MNKICSTIKTIDDVSIFNKIEKQYGIEIPESVKEFFILNNAGIPYSREICVQGREYEIRYFLSFNESDHNEIFKALESFQKETKGKIIPLAKDSADNYYCQNLENDKIYYWDKEDGLYYKLSDSFCEFIDLIK